MTVGAQSQINSSQLTSPRAVAVVEFAQESYLVSEHNRTLNVCISLSNDTVLQGGIVLDVDYLTVDDTAVGE